MARRLALVLDIGFGTLQGSERSAARMHELLAGRGYEVTALRGAEVVRERVTAELAAMHRRLGPEDSFVFYFVGHGDKLRGAAGASLSGGAPPASADVMLLITHDLFLDHDPPRPGIAGVELIEWLGPLAERTGEVTVILDCCRAATMTAGGPPIDAAAQARIDDALVRATPALRAKYAVRALADEGTGGALVRLVATTQNDYAVERELADGSGRIGVFTDCLAALLERHADSDLSWDELLPELQEQVLAECATQRPGVEGARHRVPFSRRERPPVDEYPCRATRGGWILQAGALHGVELDERFNLGAATARVVEVGPDTARVELESEANLARIVRARRIACPRAQRFTWPIGQVPDAVVEALRAAPELALVDPDDPDAVAHVELAAPVALAQSVAPVEPAEPVEPVEPVEPAEPVVPVEPAASGTSSVTPCAVLRERGGAVVHAETGAWTPRAQLRMVHAMRRVARWSRQSAALAGLTSPPLVHHAWGRVGSDEPLPAGAELHAGDRVWVRVWGTGERPEVFVSLFRLRADRSLVHCNADLDHGASVARNRSVDLTALAGGEARPVALEWCEQVPRGGPCDEALLLIASVRPRSLHRMATSAVVEPAQAAPWTPRGELEGPGLAAIVLPYRLFPAPGEPG